MTDQSKQNQPAAAEPSGPRADTPEASSTGSTAVRSNTPENKEGHINPSAPGNTGTTHGTNAA